MCLSSQLIDLLINILLKNCRPKEIVICFDNEEDLNNYLNMLEEAKKRDHRKLGKELEIFMLSEYGPGFPFFLPNGMIIRNELENFWYKEHEKEIEEIKKNEDGN